MATREKTITVKLTKSRIGFTERQRETLKGLGLTKLNSMSTLKDTPAVRGMITKVCHMVEIVEAAR